MPTTLTAHVLRQLLHYDPETGVFTWLVSRGPKHTGDPAGSVSQQGYNQICVNRKTHRSNRLAVLYVTGEWPAGVVDHRNGCRTDDRWENLRDVTRAMNSHNIRDASKTNQCGLLGVFYLKAKGRWTARLRKAGKDHYIGMFDSAEEAHAAYLLKKAEVHPGYIG